MPELEDDRQDAPEAGQYLRVIRERAWIIILAVVVVVGAAVAMSYLATPQYRASAKLLYQTNTLDRALFGSQVFANTDQVRDVETGAELVKIQQVAEAVKEQLGSARSPGALLGMVNVTPSTTTNVLEIDAVSEYPQEAADVGVAAEWEPVERPVDEGCLLGMLIPPGLAGNLEQPVQGDEQALEDRTVEVLSIQGDDIRQGGWGGFSGGREAFQKPSRAGLLLDAHLDGQAGVGLLECRQALGEQAPRRRARGRVEGRGQPKDNVRRGNGRVEVPGISGLGAADEGGTPGAVGLA